MTSMEQPNEPVPAPGEFIREELKDRGWTQEELARIMDRPLTRVNEIIQGKQGITPETAVSLAVAFDSTPDVWLRREAEYRLWIQRQIAKRVVAEGNPLVARRKRVYSMAPIKELQKRGWIGTSSEIDDLERDLSRFFGVTSLNEEPPVQAAMRKAYPNVVLTPAQRAWVFRVRQIAAASRVASFDPAGVPACKRELRKLAAFSAEVGKVPKVLAKYGIRFAVVEPLSGGKVDGVATWLSADSPVIGMSLRFDRIDSFWFTLGHELSHIDHHDDVPLDGDVSGHEELLEVKSPIERRADEESAALFIAPDELLSFIARVGPLYSKDRINQFANRIKLHPGVIVGQLQNRGEMGFSANREMLVKFRHILTPVALTDGWGNTIDSRVFA